MASEDDRVLDEPDSEELEYAVSEGGDSLLDSEEEKELIPEDLSLPLPAQQTSSMVNEDSKTPTNHKLAPSPPPSSLSPSLLNTLFTQCRQSSGKPKVIQLDKRRKFRCLPDSLPDVPLPKRMQHQKKPFTVRPRKITKPSLLLEVGKGWMADHHTGRQSSHPTASFSSPPATSAGSPALIPSHSAGLLRVNGTANAGMEGVVVSPSFPSAGHGNNPFFAKMRELSEPTQNYDVNPFLSALQKGESFTEKQPSQPNSFSFSLAQFTK